MFAPSDVYGVVVDRQVRFDACGSVTETLAPDSAFWMKRMIRCNLLLVHPYQAPMGRQEHFVRSGSSVDFVSEDLLTGSVFCFLTGRTVPAQADVSFIDPFIPPFLASSGIDHWYTLNMHRDYDLENPVAPEPSDRRSIETFHLKNKLIINLGKVMALELVSSLLGKLVAVASHWYSLHMLTMQNTVLAFSLYLNRVDLIFEFEVFVSL